MLYIIGTYALSKVSGNDGKTAVNKVSHIMFKLNKSRIKPTEIKYETRSLAVAVAAHRTAWVRVRLRYSYRPFLVFFYLQFRTEVRFWCPSAFLRLCMANRYILVPTAKLTSQINSLSLCFIRTSFHNGRAITDHKIRLMYKT